MLAETAIVSGVSPKNSVARARREVRGVISSSMSQLSYHYPTLLFSGSEPPAQ
jgi:hypothetical protein